MEKSKLISSRIDPTKLMSYLYYADRMDDISRNLTMKYVAIGEFRSAFRSHFDNDITYNYECNVLCYYKSKYICSLHAYVNSKYNCRPESVVKIETDPTRSEINSIISNSSAVRRAIIKDLKITEDKYDEFCKTTLDLQILDEKRAIESISKDIKEHRNSIKKLETTKALHKVTLDNLVLQRKEVKAKGKTKKYGTKNSK